MNGNFVLVAIVFFVISCLVSFIMGMSYELYKRKMNPPPPAKKKKKKKVAQKQISKPRRRSREKIEIEDEDDIIIEE